MTFDDLVFETRRIKPELGKQAVVAFPNGYVASVVIGPYTYGGEEGLYELAVGRGTLEKWALTYDTPVTDDVLGHLTPEDVTALLQQIKNLPPSL